MWSDFGDFTLTGIAPTAMGGPALFDRIELLRTLDPTLAATQPSATNIADFERHLTDYNVKEELKQELAFNPDLIIIAVGENAGSPSSDEAKAQFAKAFANLFEELSSPWR